MTTKNAAPGVPGQREPKRGQLVTGPGGDRRIRLADYAPPVPDQTVRVGLDQVLLDEVSVELDKDTTIELHPMTLKALARIERLYKEDPHIFDVGPDGDEVLTTHGIITFACILANQSRAANEEIAYDVIARKITVENLKLVGALINQALSPLSDALAAKPRRGGGTPAGPASSGGSSGSAGSAPASSGPTGSPGS